MDAHAASEFDDATAIGVTTGRPIMMTMIIDSIWRLRRMEYELIDKYWWLSHTTLMISAQSVHNHEFWSTLVDTSRSLVDSMKWWINDWIQRINSWSINSREIINVDTSTRNVRWLTFNERVHRCTAVVDHECGSINHRWQQWSVRRNNNYWTITMWSFVILFNLSMSDVFFIVAASV